MSAPAPDAWDETCDFLIVGSGGGSMVAGLLVADAGKQAIVLEKTDKVGGSTSMSGGILWIPNNPLLARDGLPDSLELARTYLDAAVGNTGPGTSDARKTAFLAEGPRMIDYLERKGIPFLYCNGWSDYHDDLPGGRAVGRSVAVEPFDANLLGAWNARLRRGPSEVPVRGTEGRRLMLLKRNLDGKLAALRLGWRLIRGRLLGRNYVGAGTALQGRMLQLALRHKVDVRTGAGVTDIVEQDGRVVGVVAQIDGKPVRIRARDGVLINAGGFSHNAAMRRQYGPQPSSTDWTNANPGDTGEMIEVACNLGAALDNTDQAAWVLTSLPPSGQRFLHVLDLPKPHCILVDQMGKRFTDEAQSYMANGQAVYANGDVPVWAIIESRHRDRYPWSFHAGATPEEWITSGYMKKAATIAELAAQINVPAVTLTATIERFNGFARTGKDLDFGRGERAYDLIFADPTHGPNPGLGAIEQAPFYAVAIYPGDVGTVGGVVTDENARVLRKDGSPIPGLYATGNSTAWVMGRAYPGPGAPIANAFVFGWIAAGHAMREHRAQDLGQP